VGPDVGLELAGIGPVEVTDRRRQHQDVTGGKLGLQEDPPHAPISSGPRGALKTAIEVPRRHISNL
jgi:hypothetical protein